MLLVTVVSILTGPNTLTVLLEYTNLFNLNHNGKANIRAMLIILDLTLPHIFKPNFNYLANRISLEFVPVSCA